MLVWLNPSTSSENITQKHYFGHFKVPVTLKIRSRSSNLINSSPLPKIHPCKFGKKTSTDSEDNAWKPYFGHFKVPV